MLSCFHPHAHFKTAGTSEGVSSSLAYSIHVPVTPLLQSTGKWYIKAMTGGVLPLVKRPTSLTLWSPGSRFRGVYEVTSSLEQSLMNKITSLSADMEQDLLVVTRET